MAKDLNKVQMTGRLGADPELRQTPQGHAITTFRVASNRTWRSPDGQTQEETEWFRVVAWNRLAEVCHKWLAKGVRVYVEGRLQTRQWQDEDGQHRILTEVIASDMIILDRRDLAASDEAVDVDEAVHAPLAEPPAPARRSVPPSAAMPVAQPAPTRQVEAAPAAEPPAAAPPTRRPPARRPSGPARPAAIAGAATSLPPSKPAFAEEDLPF